MLVNATALILTYSQKRACFIRPGKVDLQFIVRFFLKSMQVGLGGHFSFFIISFDPAHVANY